MCSIMSREAEEKGAVQQFNLVPFPASRHVFPWFGMFIHECFISSVMPCAFFYSVFIKGGFLLLLLLLLTGE